MWWSASLLVSLLIAMAGAGLASFWAVVAYRRTQGLAWQSGRSRCDHCGCQVAWYDNIPMVSYVALQGRCRYCRQKISQFYFIWEWLLAGWSVSWWWFWCPLAIYFTTTDWSVWQQPVMSVVGGWSGLGQSMIWWCVGAVLLWTALVDIQTHEIATGWLVVVLILTLSWLGCQWWIGAWGQSQFMAVMIGSITVGLVFELIDKVCQYVWHKPGIGRGDTYLIMLLAWWLTPIQLLVMFLLSFWLGAAVGLVYLAVKKDKRNTTLAFLPFINAAFIISYLWGEIIFSWWCMGKI